MGEWNVPLFCKDIIVEELLSTDDKLDVLLRVERRGCWRYWPEEAKEVAMDDAAGIIGRSMLSQIINIQIMLSNMRIEIHFNKSKTLTYRFNVGEAKKQGLDSLRG